MSSPSMGIGGRGASTLSVAHSPSSDHDPHPMPIVWSGLQDDISVEEGHTELAK
ncbi:hypothetical protein K443DRAFT_11275 [Laccaria amethystina LaAM-08-1]|uniref:Uncharacterized protein n=1 Tax=Laccaria amethystina LaAM-08-1 TaxID=1095629 RepID=A0A0C9XHJ2_9AGAR|nr:hypothetical protein K443DRAFT_11275 [Laccaria amethystina LaAM-08-1]